MPTSKRKSWAGLKHNIGEDYGGDYDPYYDSWRVIEFHATLSPSHSLVKVIEKDDVLD